MPFVLLWRVSLTTCNQNREITCFRLDCIVFRRGDHGDRPRHEPEMGNQRGGAYRWILYSARCVVGFLLKIYHLISCSGLMRQFGGTYVALSTLVNIESTSWRGYLMYRCTGHRRANFCHHMAASIPRQNNLCGHQLCHVCFHDPMGWNWVRHPHGPTRGILRSAHTSRTLPLLSSLLLTVIFISHSTGAG
jgi:hypothetical protein